ncbi:MAG: helix-turn-helix domain-containing protein [Atopobiaceae bacterium]|nr:helix-turn-helix domain-containing protein [Atopobiaceae bacterium]
MPRKRKLDHEQELELFEMVRKGYSNKDIAKKFGIAQDTVGTYYHRTLRERGREQERSESRERLVAQRKLGQRLTFGVEEGYVGHATVNGVEETCTLMAKDDTDAIGKFDKWCADMRAEQEFMGMVECRDEPQPQPLEGIRPIQVVELPVEREPVPSDERIREAIHEAQQEFDAITTKHMEATGVPLADTSEPAYLIWAKRPEPKCYGLFLTMDAALAEVDRLNEVAKFLGSDGAFEVEEVEWKVGQ